MDPVFVGDEAAALATTTVYSDGEEHCVQIWDVQRILELKDPATDLKPDGPNANCGDAFPIAEEYRYVDAPVGYKAVAPGHHIIGGP